MFRRVVKLIFFSVFSLALLSASYASDIEKTNLSQMQKFYAEVVNEGNFELMDKMCTKDFVEHEDLPGEGKTLADVKQFFKKFRAAFPDMKFEVSQMIAKDDKVISYITITGTHQGAFMGTLASGKKINVKGIDIIRFVDGKASEHWGVTETMTMMQQIGALPDPMQEN